MTVNNGHAGPPNRIKHEKNSMNDHESLHISELTQTDDVDVPRERKPVHWSSEKGMGNEDPFGSDLFASSEGERFNRWSISWADLMMTMFIFFVLMYVYQTKTYEIKMELGESRDTISDRGAYQAMNLNTSKTSSSVTGKNQQIVLDEFVDKPAQVEMMPDKAVRISLAGDIRFSVGSVLLNSKARWRLRQIGNFLKDNDYAVNVVGHTDDTVNPSPKYPTHWELSTARACAVARYLMEDEDVAESRIFVSGHSNQHPLVPNTSARNRALNRRVEVIVMKEIPYADPMGSKAAWVPGVENDGDTMEQNENEEKRSQIGKRERVIWEREGGKNG